MTYLVKMCVLIGHITNIKERWIMDKQGTLRKLLLQIESTQTEQLLNELGIELQDNEGNIKSISKIIDEIGNIAEIHR